MADNRHFEELDRAEEALRSFAITPVMDGHMCVAFQTCDFCAADLHLASAHAGVVEAMRLIGRFEDSSYHGYIQKLLQEYREK